MTAALEFEVRQNWLIGEIKYSHAIGEIGLFEKCALIKHARNSFKQDHLNSVEKMFVRSVQN